MHSVEHVRAEVAAWVDRNRPFIEVATAVGSVLAAAALLRDRF